MEEAVDIIISKEGSRLGITGERIAVYEKKEIVFEIPIFQVRSISVEGQGISLSSNVILTCAREGILVFFSSKSGNPEALLSSPSLNATIKTRRDQLAALEINAGMLLVKTILAAKIHNQANVIKYALKNKPEYVNEEIAHLLLRLEELKEKINGVEGSCLKEARNELLGYEGNAGVVYWDLFKRVCKIPFEGRKRRGAIDPVNQCLNYGYGILYRVVWSALLKSGLEPFAGLLHTDRAGKPSMVLDAIEEFRAPLVDRVIIALANRDQPLETEGTRLKSSTCSLIAREVLKRLESKERYKGGGYQVYSIIVSQCRDMAAHLRGEKIYKPYSFKW